MLTLAAALVACSGTETPDAPAQSGPAAAEAPQPAAQPPEPPALDKDALEAQAKDVILVPSPSEMQDALAEAGVAQGLSALVGDRSVRMESDNPDVVAVRTGVVLAYALLTVKEADTATLLKRLDDIKAGMTALGAGTDINATIDDIKGRLSSDSLSRDDLLAELDEIHGAIIPEIEYEAGARVVPLIQAGSWLAGVNVVAEAIVQADNATAATRLLRQPEVADYFLQYVRTEGSDKAPPEVIGRLEQTLTHLKELATRPELTVDDAKDVKARTDNVLALL
ncbi:MAG: hypothetical protein D6798_15025 [Deltaproteobacteria bacterium]|nr:MAG: hypothetical protein D6798_15025 [Deltaproteobacteria bacterium]